MRNIILFIATGLLSFGVAHFFISLYPKMPIATGYAAKKMCSCIFVAERTQENIQDNDLDFNPLSKTKSVIDYKSKTVTSTLYGLAKRTAVYRNDLGCILLNEEDDHSTNLKIDRPTLSDTVLFPLGNKIDTSLDTLVDYTKLMAAIEGAFTDSAKTRAVVVLKGNKLIAEKYAEGFTSDTKILGWSMTKSIIATLIGIQEKQGKVNLTDAFLFSNWTDERNAITVKDLLQMQSGLEFEEEYGKVSDATKMLYKSDDVTEIPKDKKLANKPGEVWSYSSGTTNLLSGLVQQKMGNKEEYLKFPYDSLFSKIGMTSATMETDEVGNYIGSSYCYATPRDWAKFGLLYLNQGNWFGEQIIDSTWVDFVRTPAANSAGLYGGHFWLNAKHSKFPNAPEDLYYCKGFQGQFVFIIPSKNLVIVRMGLVDNPAFKADGFLKKVTESFH